MERIHAWLLVVVALLVGRRCLGCGARGRPTPCPTCLSTLALAPPGDDACFLDAGPMRRLVRVAKSGDWRRGGAALAGLVVEGWVVAPELRPRVDLVTWVPADRHRRARRGGHLPERLARTLARHLGVPAVGLLTRRRGGPAQRGLDRSSRARNANAAFSPHPRACSRLARPGSRVRVLLVDDVRTTGATLLAATAALPLDPADVVPMALVGVPKRVHARSGAGVQPGTRCEQPGLRILGAPADAPRHRPQPGAPGLTTSRPP